MTTDDVDRTIADAAVVDDADLGSPALTAALVAAMEALVDMPEPSDRTPDAGSADADPPYVSPSGRALASGARRALLAVAAAAVIATGVGGYVLLGGDTTRTNGTAATPDAGPSGEVPPCPEPGAGAGGDVTTTTVQGGDTTTTTVNVGETTTTTINDTSSTTTGNVGETTTTLPSDLGDPPPPDPALCLEERPSDETRPLREGLSDGTPDPDPSPSPPPDDAVAPPADAPLADRVEFAFEQGYRSHVVVVRDDDDHQGTTLTVDEQTGTVREVVTGAPPDYEDGTILTDTGPAGFDGSTPTGTRSVDHCRNEYVDTPGYERHDTATGPVVEFLRSGTAVEDGHEVIDGRDTLRLRHESGTLIWLDTDTLWPVRFTNPTSGGSVVSFEFLPRTAESLALLVPPIEGMMKVDQDRSSEPCPS